MRNTQLIVSPSHRWGNWRVKRLTSPQAIQSVDNGVWIWRVFDSRLLACTTLLPGGLWETSSVGVKTWGEGGDGLEIRILWLLPSLLTHCYSLRWPMEARTQPALSAKRWPFLSCMCWMLPLCQAWLSMFGIHPWTKQVKVYI